MTSAPQAYDFVEVVSEFIGVFRNASEKYKNIKPGEIFLVAGWTQMEKGQLLHLIYPKHHEAWKDFTLATVPYLDVIYYPMYLEIIDKNKNILVELLWT